MTGLATPSALTRCCRSTASPIGGPCRCICPAPPSRMKQWVPARSAAAPCIHSATTLSKCLPRAGVFPVAPPRGSEAVLLSLQGDRPGTYPKADPRMPHYCRSACSCAGRQVHGPYAGISVAGRRMLPQRPRPLHAVGTRGGRVVPLRPADHGFVAAASVQHQRGQPHHRALRDESGIYVTKAGSMRAVVALQ